MSSSISSSAASPYADQWHLQRQVLDLSCRGIVMGILNTTPDSFFSKSRCLDPQVAQQRALSMIAEGATILDLGGESTRPGARSVSVEEELQRLLPVLKAIRSVSDVLLSIDTSKAEVAVQALKHGADIINDVTALQGDSRMAEVIAAAQAGVVLMHMKGEPLTMQQEPDYHSIVDEVVDFLHQRLDFAQAAGIPTERVVLDPGIGFGKTFAHNHRLLQHCSRFSLDHRPLLIGVSQKAFLQDIPEAGSSTDRLWPGLAITSWCSGQGARIFRVHQVRAHYEVLKMTEHLRAS